MKIRIFQFNCDIRTLLPDHLVYDDHQKEKEKREKRGAEKEE